MMTEIPPLPSLPEIPNMGELGTLEWGAHEGTVTPLSVADRVTRVQNHVCENILHSSTLRLQSDMRQKMKSYAAEKRELLRQLAKLTHDIKLLRVPDKSRPEDPDKPDLGDPDKPDRVPDRSQLGLTDMPHFRFRNKQGSPRSTREQKPAGDSFPEVSDKPHLRVSDKPHFIFRYKQVGARRTREQKSTSDSFPDGHALPPISDRFQIRPEHQHRDKDIDAEKHLQMFDQAPELKFNENLDIHFSSLALCSDLQSGPEQRISDQRLPDQRLSEQRLPDQRLSDQRLSKKKKAAQDAPAFRLPQLTRIREEQPQPHWYSGRNSQTFDQKARESPTVLENLKEVRDMTESYSYSLPSVRDPVRSDVCITSKPDFWMPSEPDIWMASLSEGFIPSNSDVSIPSKPDVFVPSNSDICDQSKPQARKVCFSDKVSRVVYKGSLPQISKRCRETAKKRCERLSEVVRSRLNAGRDDWRSAYLDIQDKEERNRTLGDVLHTVRARMRHNERQLKNSQRPSEDSVAEREEDGSEDLLANKEEKNTMKRTQNKQRRNAMHNQSFKHLRRRSNATQLQNYLTKLSRERRMCELMECEGYRRLHTSSPGQQESST